MFHFKSDLIILVRFLTRLTVGHSSDVFKRGIELYTFGFIYLRGHIGSSGSHYTSSMDLSCFKTFM